MGTQGLPSEAPSSVRFFLVGALFGSAVLAAGVWSPQIITQQLQLQSFHMLKTFLTASATSALAVSVANHVGFASVQPRDPSSYGWFWAYDANVVGGLFIGFGMALSGICPGTLLVQLATGTRSAIFTLSGALLGAIAFVKIEPLLRRTRSPVVEPKSGPGGAQTIYGLFGTSKWNALIVYELACLLTIGAATIISPDESWWLNPIVGGLLIGGAQVISLMLLSRTIGVSAVYASLASYFWNILSGKSNSSALKTPSVVFAAGMIAGSAALTTFLPISSTVPSSISNSRSTFGGAFLAIGARMAGGCTAGHGISGMATFALSSFTTVAAMFAGGIVLAIVLS